MGAGLAMPALLTSPARPRSPTVSVTVAAAAAIVDSSVTSRITGVIASGPELRNVSPSSARRTPANTWKPFSARWTAVAAPTPVDVPVTTTKP